MIKIPSGPSRKYVTDVAFAKKKEAREAVARLALDMGAVDFLQTGDDKKHLDRARANKDGEASDGVVSTLGGKVHHYDVDVVPPSPAIARIEECCQTWRTGKVSPHWLVFAHLQDPRRKFSSFLLPMANVRPTFLAHRIRCHASNPSDTGDEQPVLRQSLVYARRIHRAR